jgi:hypothetical protein
MLNIDIQVLRSTCNSENFLPTRAISYVDVKTPGSFVYSLMSRGMKMEAYKCRFKQSVQNGKTILGNQHYRRT